MRLLYTFALICYARIIWLASFQNDKAKQWWQGRKQKNWLKVDFTKDEWLWFHCASLGEFDQGIPLIEDLKARLPNAKILVTFFSPSGMTHYQKRKAPIDFACYLPIDTKKAAQEFLHHLEPKMAVFVKYEFWHNHISVCSKMKIPVFSVSSIFRKNQVFFKWYGCFFRQTLLKISQFYVQNEESKQLLKGIGIHEVKVVGDLRFDRVIANAQKAQAHTNLSSFCAGRPVFIIGSCWPEDEDLILPFVNQLSAYKIIIAPHDISENRVNAIQKALGRSPIRFTQFEKWQGEEVLILDTIGHLMNAYSLSKIAYVGGGFKGSLHNVLEPIAFQIPVLFGPKHEKFPEAELFKQKGIGFEIRTAKDLEEQFKTIEDHYSQTQLKIHDFLATQQNIAAQIGVELVEWIG